MSITMKQLPELERPYEKLELYGEKTLSNAELLAIIIKTGTKEETSVQVAQKILNLNENKTEGLEFLQDISIEELMQIKGIGKVKAIQLKAICELSIRMFKTTNYKKITVRTAEDIAKTLMYEMNFLKTEMCKVIILNNKSQILKIKDIAVGTANFVDIPMKEILSDPIRMRAPKIILVHNHPSGNSIPSDADINYTFRLLEMGKMFGIELVDHIVIGKQSYTSIFEKVLVDYEEQQRLEKEKRKNKDVERKEET